MATNVAPRISEDELAKTVAAWLRAERAKKPGLTQRAIAEELGLTEAAPGQWEAGRAMPSADRLARLVVVFGFSLLALHLKLNQLPAKTRPATRARAKR
jgi:transcriptional regulator with XRE-family HTH domain